jgi:hypothetical protein
LERSTKDAEIVKGEFLIYALTEFLGRGVGNREDKTPRCFRSSERYNEIDLAGNSFRMGRVAEE